MYIRNDLHIKLHAEDYIRARLMEAENYRMLNQLRKHRQNRILRLLQLFFERLGHALISLGERLVNERLPSASYGENG
jgi:hypothetical protein